MGDSNSSGLPSHLMSTITQLNDVQEEKTKKNDIFSLYAADVCRGLASKINDLETLPPVLQATVSKINDSKKCNNDAGRQRHENFETKKRKKISKNDNEKDEKLILDHQDITGTDEQLQQRKVLQRRLRHQLALQEQLQSWRMNSQYQSAQPLSPPLLPLHASQLSMNQLFLQSAAPVPTSNSACDSINQQVMDKAFCPVVSTLEKSLKLNHRDQHFARSTTSTASSFTTVQSADPIGCFLEQIRNQKAKLLDEKEGGQHERSDSSNNDILSTEAVLSGDNGNHNKSDDEISFNELLGDSSDGDDDSTTGLKADDMADPSPYSRMASDRSHTSSQNKTTLSIKRNDQVSDKAPKGVQWIDALRVATARADKSATEIVGYQKRTTTKKRPAKNLC